MPEPKTPRPASRESVMKKPSGGSRRRTSHQKADKKKGKLDDDGTQVEQPWRERPKPKERKTASRMDKTVEAPAYDDKLKEFAMSCVERGPTEIVSEFARVKMETQPPPIKTAFDANGVKNRYKDVFCTETSRVVLKDAFVASSGDYIHANWVKVRGEERFICTQ
ncbi:Protein T27A3.5, partial [Aphelenchoides avenae]